VIARPVLLAALLLGCPVEPEPEPPAAACGDGVTDDGEACDDGNAWGGDGCTEACTVEAGPAEVEPNDVPAEAELVGAVVDGSLPPGDRDCFGIEVAEAGSVSATLTPGPGGECGFEAVLELLDPDGVRVASGLPGAACPAIDPTTNTWARYLTAGTWTVCVEGALGAVVPSYVLAIETADSCDDLPPLVPDPGQDFEGDGVADVCDPDDDDDGVDDDLDNCPEAPNGPEQPFPWGTADDGFINLWGVLGPFVTGVTPGSCEPSPDSFTGADDAEAAPAVGDRVDDLPWFAAFSRPGRSAVVRFTDWFAVDAPREAYAMTWLRVDEARDAELALGSDDGHAVWLNGESVGVDAGCHGVGTDAFRYPVQLEAGWNRLLIKVYDGGGGWGLIARLYEADGETPMTDVDASIGGPEPWADDQTDGDGDGIGDLCDVHP